MLFVDIVRLLLFVLVVVYVAVSLWFVERCCFFPRFVVVVVVVDVDVDVDVVVVVVFIVVAC